VQNLRGCEVGRAAKFSNPRAGATVEALSDREGNQANTNAEKEEMLRGESFHRNDRDQYNKLPPVCQPPKHITEHSVKRALFSQSVKKAPCPDKLSFRAIRLLWKWDKPRILQLRKAAVRPGRHAVIWNSASQLVNRNPGKLDCTKLKSY
jgi:hypothetical protein